MKKIFGNKLVTCKTHWIIYWFWFLLAIVMLSGIPVMAPSEGIESVIAFTFGAVVFAIIPLYRLLANKIVLTDKMLYCKKGIIKTKELSAPIEKIQNIEIKSGLLGKCFKYADVDIDTVSQHYRMHGVKNAEALVEAYYNARG